mmetsp:Transcript_49210/g.123710  ORF Transcript_49210/g.123710 Transcript_49210/m.123710 type:complete len:215 (-) Transcript_49210:1495-2139(-)
MMYTSRWNSLKCSSSTFFPTVEASTGFMTFTATSTPLRTPLNTSPNAPFPRSLSILMSSYLTMWSSKSMKEMSGARKSTRTGLIPLQVSVICPVRTASVQSARWNMKGSAAVASLSRQWLQGTNTSYLLSNQQDTRVSTTSVIKRMSSDPVPSTVSRMVICSLYVDGVYLTRARMSPTQTTMPFAQKCSSSSSFMCRRRMIRREKKPSGKNLNE